MLFTTSTEWAALGFMLVAGWFFGLASSSGGKKWKRQLEDAELNYASARDRDETELREAQDRVRELERQLRDSRQAPSTAPVVAAAAAGAVGATLIEQAQERAEAASELQAGGIWIPEGPPPPPLPISSPETQPVEPTPAPAPVQEEVAPASTAAMFPAAASTTDATADAGGADPAAPRAADPAEPAGSVSEAQASNEWLPPHVRADPPPRG